MVCYNTSILTILYILLWNWLWILINAVCSRWCAWKLTQIELHVVSGSRHFIFQIFSKILKFTWKRKTYFWTERWNFRIYILKDEITFSSLYTQISPLSGRSWLLLSVPNLLVYILFIQFFIFYLFLCLLSFHLSSWSKYLRDAEHSQIGWIFGKVPKEGGSYSIQNFILQNLNL